MTKKQLTQLIEASYTKNVLDEVKVQKIAKVLSRTLLKKYIKALKNEEDRKNVIVTLPKLDKETELREFFKGLFGGKNIVFEVDPDLLLGLRIKNNDLIYEENLRETLENMLEYLKQ